MKKFLTTALIFISFFTYSQNSDERALQDYISEPVKLIETFSNLPPEIKDLYRIRKITYNDNNKLVYLGQVDLKTIQPNGVGILFENSKHAFYCGNFVQGIKSGLGYYYVENMSRYYGYFCEGAYEGSGILIVTMENSEFMYRGEFRNGMMNGFGVLKQDKRKYEGEFKDGLYNGIGTLTISLPEEDVIIKGVFEKGQYLHQ